MGFSPVGGGFNAFIIIWVLAVVIILGAIIFAIVRGIAQWNKNNNSPVLTVDAKIVAKRIAVDNHTYQQSDNMAMTQTSTTYYATFEVESGDRMELRVQDREYGMLAEGDVGKLTFQGTRYKGFERKGLM